MRRTILLITAMAVMVASYAGMALAASQITNSSFETGNLSGWSVDVAPGGNASAVQSFGNYTAKDGNHFALLTPGQVGVYTMVSQPFSANKDDKISGWTFFKAGDYLPYNDEGQIQIINTENNSVVATPFNKSVSSVGNFGATPWTHWEHTFAASGTFKVVAQVKNSGDSGYSSRIGLDDISTFTADTTPPQLSLSADITKEATGPNGAAVSYTATAIDDKDGSMAANCSPASGSTFPLATTPVNCSATDAAGNKATGSFNVTVQDTTPPEISGMPSDISKTATSSSGATVNYAQPAASDLVDGSVPANCSPASGSTFALGGTTVICSASDSRNNTAQKSFKVNVTFSWSGVLQPINGGTTLGDYSDDTSSFRLGSTVPVKFKLSGESAGITDATAKLLYAKISDNVAGAEADAETTAASTTGNLFRYDATSDQYIFNWGTKGLEAGTYQLRIDLGDGTTNTVRVLLR